jgi:hypothetical protein
MLLSFPATIVNTKGRAPAHGFGERADRLRLMPELGEPGEHRRGHPRFDVEVAPGKARLGEAWRLRQKTSRGFLSVRPETS